jgi:hypothetical protein
MFLPDISELLLNYMVALSRRHNSSLANIVVHLLLMANLENCQKEWPVIPVSVSAITKPNECHTIPQSV